MECKTVIELLTLALAVGAFAVGLSQYRHAQAWKRREFVAAEVEKLVNSPQTRNALNMLDYTLRWIELYPDAVDPNKRYARISREYAAAMLMPHAIDNRPHYGIAGAAIRDCFDELLTKLENLQSMIVAGLIEKDDIAPYLSYWIRRIYEPLSPEKDEEIQFHRNLRLYIDTYNYRGVQNLCASFGYDIKPKQGDLEALKAECASGRWKQRVDEWKGVMKEAVYSKGGSAS